MIATNAGSDVAFVHIERSLMVGNSAANGGVAYIDPSALQSGLVVEITDSTPFAASLFAWRAAPRQRLFVCCLAAYGIANWLILAAVEGNLGNLLRHRLTLDACLLILGGAGLEWMWMRVARSATALTYPDSAAARSPVPQPRR